MYTKRHIEKILRINGLSLNASDAEIKSVLSYAKCKDVDSIISALRNEQTEADRDLCGAQPSGSSSNVLLAEDRLQPESIKTLLGIDVEVKYADIEALRERRQSVSFLQVLSILGWSVVCAAVAMGGVLWYYNINVMSLLP